MYDVGSERVQGTWERDLAVKMSELGVTWTKKHQNSITYIDRDGRQRRYTPDFLVQELSMRLELKGFWWGNDREKMTCVLEQFPDEKIVIIEERLFHALMQCTLKEQFVAMLTSTYGVVGSAPV